MIGGLSTINSGLVAPVRERGLKYVALQYTELIVNVAPVRERGLKYACFNFFCCEDFVAPVRERGLKSKTS